MKIINFFSYKGGAGRSTLAYNIIPILAAEHYRPTKESPMILVDTDVDSCGMSVLARASDKVQRDACVQYLFEHGCFRAKSASISVHPFLKKLIPVGNAYGYEDNDAILLLPAMHNYTWEGTHFADTDTAYRDAMADFLKVCKEFGVPAVVIDSAVGNTSPATVSNNVANVIVTCMRPTLQFINGTYQYFCGLEDSNGNIDLLGKDFILVPNVVPQRATTINSMYYPDTAVSKIRNDFLTRFGDSFQPTYHFDFLDKDEFGIPALDRFMWREDSLFLQDNLNEEEERVLSIYRKLANLIDKI